MNKLMGFYELKKIGLPTVRWEEYSEEVNLSEEILWTVRTALLRGNDYNLPRIVGVTAREARKKAREFKEILKDNGMVIYYPYFIADKSGTMKVSHDNIVIEAVGDDLWNLVTKGCREVTLVIGIEGIKLSGNREFLTVDETDELLKFGKLLRRKYTNDIISGNELYLEWSYAYDSTLESKPSGGRYLVFYEMRVI